jgi:hypothetical protein
VKRREDRKTELIEYVDAEFSRIGIGDKWRKYVEIPDGLLNISTSDKLAHSQIDSIIAIVANREEQDGRNRIMIGDTIDTLNRAFSPIPALDVTDVKELMAPDEINVIKINKRLKEIAEIRVEAVRVAKELETVEVVEEPVQEETVVESPKATTMGASPSKPKTFKLMIQIEHLTDEYCNDVISYFNEAVPEENIIIHKFEEE